MKPRMRQALIYGALLATGLAAFLAPPAEEPVPSRREPELSATMPVVAPGVKPAVQSTVALAPKKRGGLMQQPTDLFHIEQPPPPTVAHIEPAYVAPPPMAPPLPYVYMGKSFDQGQVSVFLTRNNKPYIARQGDVLDGQYRIDAINPPLLEFTYLPLAQKQMLNIGVIR